MPALEAKIPASTAVSIPEGFNFGKMFPKSEVCPPFLAVFEFGFECLEDGDTIAIERQGAAVAFYEGVFSNWMI